MFYMYIIERWVYFGTMETADLYLRQSKARDDSISLEIQEAQCRLHAERQGYSVRRVIVDEGVSGYRDWQKRPGFPTLLDDPADVIVVYRWSRLSRRRLDQVNLIHLLEQAGTRVESAVEPVDPSTAGGRLSRDQMLLIAAYESDVKSEQWKEALRRREANGLPTNGGARFGYRKVGKTFEPDPETAPILRDLYLRYTKGAGFQSLCKDLNEKGVTTTRGGKWIVQSLLRTMDSGFAAGLLVRNRTEYLPGAQEAIITPDEWQAYRDARAHRSKLPPKRKTPAWHLAGIATCGRCGGRLVRSSGQQVVCTTYKASRACEGVWVKRVWLEQRVAVWIGAHIADFPARDGSMAAEAESIVTSLESDLAGVLAALGRLATGWAEGLLDIEAYRAAQAELVAKREDIEARLRDARSEHAKSLPINIDEFSRLEVGNVTPAEWNTLMARVLRRVEVHTDRLVIVPVIGETVEVAR